MIASDGWSITDTGNGCASLIPPMPLTIADMTVATDSGISSADNITKDSTPDFTLPCTVPNMVTLYINNIASGTGTCVGGFATITTNTIL